MTAHVRPTSPVKSPASELGELGLEGKMKLASPVKMGIQKFEQMTLPERIVDTASPAPRRRSLLEKSLDNLKRGRRPSLAERRLLILDALVLEPQQEDPDQASIIETEKQIEEITENPLPPVPVPKPRAASCECHNTIVMNVGGGGDQRGSDMASRRPSLAVRRYLQVEPLEVSEAENEPPATVTVPRLVDADTGDTVGSKEELHALRRKVDTLEKTCERWRSKEGLQRRLQAALSKECRSLRTRLSDSTARCDDLHEKCDTLHAKFISAQQENRKLKGQLEVSRPPRMKFIRARRATDGDLRFARAVQRCLRCGDHRKARVSIDSTATDVHNELPPRDQIAFCAECMECVKCGTSLLEYDSEITVREYGALCEACTAGGAGRTSNEK